MIVSWLSIVSNFLGGMIPSLTSLDIQSLLPEVFTMAAIVGISTLGQALFIWLLQDADFYAIGIAYLSLKVGDVAENYDRDLSLLRYEFIGRGILRLRQRIERSQGFADYTTLMATAYLAEIAVSRSGPVTSLGF